MLFSNARLTFWIWAPCGMRCDDWACLMASFVKAAPSRCGMARAIDKQANKHKTTFILLDETSRAPQGRQRWKIGSKQSTNVIYFSSFEYLNFYANPSSFSFSFAIRYVRIYERLARICILFTHFGRLKRFPLRNIHCKRASWSLRWIRENKNFHPTSLSFVLTPNHYWMCARHHAIITLRLHPS